MSTAVNTVPEYANKAAYAVNESPTTDAATPPEVHPEEEVAVNEPHASVELTTVVPPLKDTLSEREVDAVDEAVDKSEQTVTILESAAIPTLQEECTVGNAKEADTTPARTATVEHSAPVLLSTAAEDEEETAAELLRHPRREMLFQKGKRSL